MPDQAPAADHSGSEVHSVDHAAAGILQSGILDSIDEGEAPPPKKRPQPQAQPERAPEETGRTADRPEPARKEVDEIDRVLGLVDDEPDGEDETGDAKKAAPEDDDDQTAETDDDGKPESPAVSDDLEVSWETRDGTKLAITLGELKRGYLREADYTQKTQDLSERRQELDHTVERVKGDWKQRYEALDTILTVVEQQYGPGKPPDRAMLLTNPDQYHLDKAEWEARKEAWEGLLHHAGGLRQHAQTRQSEELKAWAAEQRVKLRETLPVLFDPKHGPKVRDMVRQELIDRGLTPDEIKLVADARHIAIVYDAMRWRRAQQAKKTVRTKVANAPQMVRPGQAPRKDEGKIERRTKSRDRARQSQSMHDHAAALADILSL